MPYNSPADLPESVKNALPKHGEEIYVAAFNSAWDQYKDPKKRRGNESGKKCLIKLLGQL